MLVYIGCEKIEDPLLFIGELTQTLNPLFGVERVFEK